MSGGTDDLHTTVVRLPVWVGADEGGEERMVNVDDARAIRVDDQRGKYLHVASENDQLDRMVAQSVENRAFLLRARVGSDRKVDVRNSHVLHEIGMIRMVVDDHGDLGGKLAGTPATEEVEQAMRLLRRQNADAGECVGELQVDRHRIARRDRIEGLQDLVTIQAEAVELELDPLEEDLLHVVGVLLGVHDVSTVLGDEIRDGGDDPALVGAREKQDGGRGHDESVRASRQ